MTGFTLIDTKPLAEPANTLVNKISNAFGRHFDPRQTIRMAEAEAQADRIRRVSEAETDIEVAELRQRAANRFLNEEMTRQLNIESITEKAMPHLNDDADPGSMEDDWITNFFGKCRTVSDCEMQELWARILAGEANNPGSFSRKTVNLVSDLEKLDAQLFTNLCGFAWQLGQLYPLVFDTQHDIYNQQGIDFGSIGHLEALGLVRDGGALGFRRIGLPKIVPAYYYGKHLSLTMPRDSDNELATGKVLFTPAGLELAPICGSKPVQGFFEYVYDRWVGESLLPPR